jgi:TonB-dependent SusC/RagA subfamily outer membrane receptor
MNYTKTRKQFFVILIVSFLPMLSLSQQRTVKGRVTTFDSIPLINVEVKVISSKQVFHTDTLGHFEIRCLPNDKLKVSAKGFTAQKLKVNEETKIADVNLSLKPGPRSTEVAVGYGHVKERDKLYAISSLQNKDDNFSSYSNMYDLIRGTVPGVQVVGDEITIRGDNSINSSSVLIVVDGMEESSNVLDRLSPFDVKSIDILKDGASAIYGNKGAAGVIIITTKKGGN